MKKFVKLVFELNTKVIDGQPVISILIPRSSVNEWTLCLQLLYEDCISTCIIHNPLNGAEVEVGTGNISGHSAGAKVRQEIIRLDHHAIGFLRTFFLRYYLNGFADVDHLDINDEQNPGGYIKFRVDDFSPPVSSDEARRSLDMM